MHPPELASFEGALAPHHFFAFESDVIEFKKSGFLSSEDKYVLPPLSTIWMEEQFATVYMGWSSNSLLFLVDVKNEEIQASYPEIQKGDSIEFFIDTRNLKNTKLIHRFCHHFYFLPIRIEGVMAGEITKFHGDDKHVICNSNDIEMNVKMKSGGYVSEIIIPTECLFGYQPEEVGEIGFSFRVNRYNGASQQFTPHVRIEEHPYLWATVKLVSESK